jgi:hypothetical protein
MLYSPFGHTLTPHHTVSHTTFEQAIHRHGERARGRCLIFYLPYLQSGEQPCHSIFQPALSQRVADSLTGESMVVSVCRDRQMKGSDPLTGPLRVDEMFEPRQIFSMLWRVLSMGVDQHVHIKKNHVTVPCVRAELRNRPGRRQERRLDRKQLSA